MSKITIAEISNNLATGKCSSVEITQELLQRIKQQDEKINSFITVTEEQALAQAKAADELRSKGQANTLTGVPIAHKDNYCTDGTLTTCGSKMLSNFVAPYNATVVDKFNQTGAVSLGKLNMDEFAMGSSSESSFYGAVSNPWDTEQVAGGSSGGSAAAVAASFIAGATASDTGGSIRQLAAFCGLTGIKPTYGRVSRWGIVAYASSLDQAGVITHTAEDAALMLNVMSGFDEKDSTSMQLEVPDFTADLNNGLAGLTIGLPKEYFSADLDPAMQQAVSDAVKEYEKLGAKVKEISLPHSHLVIPSYNLISAPERSANMSRMDVVSFGLHCDNPTDIHNPSVRSRSEGLGCDVKPSILTGAYPLTAGYYGAYYKKAQSARRVIKNDFVNAFKEVDIIAGPVTPTTAFNKNEKNHDPVAMALGDVFTVALNLAGLPGMSINCGQINNLPVGLQLIGNYFEEARLLNAAHQFQQVTDWHLKSPAGL